MGDGQAREATIRRSTLAESVLQISRLARARVPARNAGDRSMRNAWALAFGAKDPSLLFSAMGRLNRHLDALSRQVSSIAELSDPTKAYIEEAVDGLRSAASLTALSNSFDHFEPHFSEDRLGRLLFANDTLRRIYPRGIPDDEAIAQFSEGVRLLIDDIDHLMLDASRSDDLRALLREILEELPLAAYFGTDLLSDVAGRLGIESLNVATAEDSSGTPPKVSEASQRFHERIRVLVKRAAEFGAKGIERVDAALTTAERVERVYRSITGGGT